MIAIGIGHRARQGKSSFASAIIENCSRSGLSCVEYSVSDAILDCAIEEGLVPPGTRRDQCDPNILVALSWEKRKDKPNFWVDTIAARIEHDWAKVAIIPNVKMPSEFGLVKDLGGVNVKITRKNPDGTRFISGDRDPNDPLETSLEFFRWDVEITNIYNRPFWLRRQAVALLEYLTDGGG